MSRLADAMLRRGIGAQATAPDQRAAGARDTLAYSADTDVPWGFDTARAHPGPQVALIEPAPPVPHRGERQLQLAPSSVSDQEISEISQLVDRLFPREARHQGRRSVVFAAVESTAGSALCAAAANVLASRTPRRVCLVDGNLRAPGIHEALGVENVHGLSEALLGDMPLNGAVKRVTENLWILPAGLRGAEAVPHLTPERIRPRLRELRERFDYLLVNAGLVSVTPEAFALAAALDGVVLVLEAHTTRRETARWVSARLQAAGASVLGAVLTNRTFPIPDAIYRHV